MGHVHVVTYLLNDASASLETRTVREETALHVAARARQTDVIKILLRHGANIDARAKVGITLSKQSHEYIKYAPEKKNILTPG